MGEILVSTTTSGAQFQPSVDSVRGTQYVAMWADGSDAGIKGQNLGRTGTKLGEEFQVSASTPPGNHSVSAPRAPRPARSSRSTPPRGSMRTRP